MSQLNNPTVLDPNASLPNASIPQERPTVITVICVLGFIGCAFLAIALLISASALSAGLLIWTVVSSIFWLACLIGMWQMRKWGAIGYTILSALGIVVSISMSQFSFFQLIFAIVLSGLALSQLDKME